MEDFSLSAAAPSRNKSLRFRTKTLALLAFLLLISSCTYRHYLGMHGPSIKRYPTLHADFKADKSCLTCHASGSPIHAPKKTNHPNFKGCLKCHNDDCPCGPQIRRDNPMGGAYLFDYPELPRDKKFLMAMP
jgi:hypothetical protein